MQNKIALDPDILEHACEAVHASWAHWGEATKTGYRSFIAKAVIAYMARAAELNGSAGT